MRKIVIILLIVGLLTTILLRLLINNDNQQDNLTTLKEKYKKKLVKKVDHSKFAVLQQKFESPQEVTTACLTCHNMTAHQIMNSNHWNWEREEYEIGRGIVYLGKRNALNNFCIGSHGNEGSCAKCHIGYGMDKDGKIFVDSLNIDCMICHDNTETYAKAPEKGGAPIPTLNFNEIAFSSGKPKRTNCGVCHFYGGGGNNVKHGDLEMSMFEPNRNIDVHMAVEGANLQCIDCHKTEQHNISGKMYSLSSMNRNRVTCEQCHGTTPHKDEIINEHNLKVACQTCHIPTYAKENPTKMFWDWSTAGKLKDGKPYTEEDSMGNHSYMSIKGSFKWAKNVKPDYIFFNGTAKHYLKGDKIEDTTKIIVLNQLFGSYDDEDSKIYPTKIHIAKQPYDPINKILIQPKLYSDKPGQGAFWTDFDWKKAAEIGMKESNLPFSGEISFIQTKMYWPVNHMVVPKEEAVKCNECHTRNNGRLSNLSGFYLPGRDYSPAIDNIAIVLIILSIVGIIIHLSFRLISKSKNGGH